MYMCKEAEPIQYFYLYFTDTFMNTLVTETKRHARQYLQIKY